MDMAYLLRSANGALQSLHDRHELGLFSREVWLQLIADSGFDPLVVPLELSSNGAAGHDVFLGLRPATSGGAQTA